MMMMATALIPGDSLALLLLKQHLLQVDAARGQWRGEAGRHGPNIGR